MECLEELERKVLHVLDRNRELYIQIEAQKKEISLLKDQNRQFEASLMKESTLSQSLETEKSVIKETIEALLESINSLEKAH
ncbi:hypothetical protein JST56_00485 [Candidatus Dependentiae bacterium]|jgi:hypothetical protein|nr:hypothetical protein [Candidatus Dependentiae bacterium]